MEPTTILIVTLVVYKLVLLTIGWVAERMTRDEGDFVLGGRRLGPLVAAISASASSSSAWTLLGVSGFAYQSGLSAVWLFPACVGGFALNWYVVAPRLRRQGRDSEALTVTEFLAGPHRGPGFAAVRWVASLILVISLTLYVSSQFKAAGKTFATQCDFSETKSLLIGAAIILAYTLMGGFWAVSLTDTLQGLLMAATAVALPVAALVAVGGPVDLWERIPAVSESFGSFLPAGGGAKILVLLAIALGYPGQPHVVNRFMAMGEHASMNRARAYAMGWAVLTYAGMILLGLAGRVLHEQAIADQETMFFTLTSELFPVVVAGMMTAAVLSAIMSTADSQLLVVGAALSHDLGFKGRSAGAALWRTRLTLVVVSALAVGMALTDDSDPDSLSGQIFASVLIAWTAIGAGFGPLLLITLWRGPVGPRVSLGTLLAGFGTTAWAYAFVEPRGGLAERLLPYGMALAVLLVGECWRPKTTD